MRTVVNIFLILGSIFTSLLGIYWFLCPDSMTQNDIKRWLAISIIWIGYLILNQVKTDDVDDDI